MNIITIPPHKSHRIMRCGRGRKRKTESLGLKRRFSPIEENIPTFRHFLRVWILWFPLRKEGVTGGEAGLFHVWESIFYKNGLQKK